MPTPLTRYQHAIDEGSIKPDPQQLNVLAVLDHIYHQLIKRQKIRTSTLGKLRRAIKPRKPIKGLYLWGKVGIGKTFMMDLFYDSLPVRKTRQHFHHFMRDLHRQLREHQGQKDPLDAIAKDIADQYLVICFDEFFVTNIADAMLLRQLFSALFARGLCLVTTSNAAPDELYLDGIQRDQFLPAIELIKQHTQTMHLSSDKDYRRQHLEKAGVYYTPNDKQAEHNLNISFQHFCQKAEINNNPITINNRQIDIVKTAGKVIWFDFSILCQPPRSQDDYLDLCQQYDTFILSNVPVISSHDSGTITLFINLVDVLYDCQRRLIISAESDIEHIYTEGRKSFEFKRTRSRLIEMNTPEYFYRPDE
jgi:cell division protein ZapE